MNFTVRPIKGELSAEVHGLDLSQNLDAATVDWVKRTLAKHPVLIFPGQKLKAADMARFGNQLGHIEKHLFQQYLHKEVPEVSYVTNRDEAGNIDQFGVKRAADWHIDEPYKEHLPQLTMLYARQVPREKGGTLFTDMRAAYDALPEARKRQIGDLKGVYRASDRMAGVGNKFEARHPVVNVNAITQRRYMMISPLQQRGFDGMPADEGMALVKELEAHAIQPEFTYYHSWKVDDLLMWDEVQTMHCNAADSDPNEPRVFMRTIVH